MTFVRIWAGLLFTIFYCGSAISMIVCATVPPYSQTTVNWWWGFWSSNPTFALILGICMLSFPLAFIFYKSNK